MQANATAPSATAAQGVPLSDGQTIDLDTFNQHIARMQGNTPTACGASAAAVWFKLETSRT